MALFTRKNKAEGKPANPDHAQAKPPSPDIPADAIALLNCVTGELIRIERDAALIGSEAGSNILLSGHGILGAHCRIIRTPTGARVERVVPEARILIDGNSEKSLDLRAGEGMFSLQIGMHAYFLIGVGRDSVAAIGRVSVNHWAYVEKKTGLPEQMIGPSKLSELLQSPSIGKLNRDNTILFLQGATVGFRLCQFLGNKTADDGHAFTGEFQCPRCWLRFDLTDMLYIAEHPDLRGDSVLGEGDMRRFQPTQFVNGRPVDEKGMPCSKTACPHCRGQLPHGYHELPVHVFSIVGISSAGKSYYLSILIHQLKRFLFRHFKNSLLDVDGTENTVLNQMTQQVMNATTPEEAYLQKTTLQGVNYKNFKRFGREVSLPQPFVYSSRSQLAPSQNSLLIFYDNAGEHFLPNYGEQAETTEHIAHCRTIFFLFDPVRHRDFNRAIRTVTDPQVEGARSTAKDTFVQDVVLGEMQRRMQDARNVSAAADSSKPLAFIVGKYDLWKHLLPESDLRTDFIVEGKFNTAAVRHNSQKVKALMMELCPDMVGCAEGISHETMYFPVSTFGSHAVDIKGKKGFFAPDPNQLEPKFIEIPTTWALSLLLPAAVPSV